MAPCHHLKACATADLTFDLNSLVPRRWDAIIEMQFLVSLLIEILKSFDNALWWMPWNLTDDKSTLVQVMAWCRQATSHYLSQCWPRSLLPHGVTRPQWVNSTVVLKNIPESLRHNSMSSTCVFLVLGNVANKKHIDRQSSKSRRASMNEGYLKRRNSHINVIKCDSSQF